MAKRLNDGNQNSFLEDFDQDDSFGILCSTMNSTVAEFSHYMDPDQIDDYFKKWNSSRDKFDNYILRKSIEHE